MARTRIGKLPPRYSLLMNAYPEERLSKCPKCRKLTHPRKFALFIHIDDWGPMVLGLTCKYCSRCETIMVHQHELEAQLAYRFSRHAPDVIGKDYMVLGTVDKKVWQSSLQGKSQELGEILKHVADFKKYYDLKVDPGGWFPADSGKA
jgi:hypothetical protein